MNIDSEALQQYLYARRKGRRTVFHDRVRQRDPYLKILDSIVDESTCSKEPLGLIDVPSHLIIGTLTRSRSVSFSSDFMPLLNEKSEFAHKWISVCRHHLSDQGISEAPDAYEYMGRFYIEEGNKRVSVLKSYGAPYIPLNVTRLLPKRMDLPSVELYYEFLDFYKVSKLYSLQFSHPGYYDRLLRYIGYEKDRIWERQDRITIVGLYERLRSSLLHKGIAVENADFMVALLELYSYDFLTKMTDKQLDHVVNENKTRLKCGKGFYTITCIADEEDPLLYSNNVKPILDESDFLISAGDLSNAYLEYIVTMTNKPLFYVKGNHDEEKAPEGCICIDDDLVVYQGIRILGLGGSCAYSNGLFQYTEAQMERRIRRLRFKILKAGGVDIVVTHAPISGYGDLDDYAHRGFKCFVTLLNELKPRFWFHGHVHRNYDPTMKRIFSHKNTMIVNVCGSYKAKY